MNDPELDGLLEKKETHLALSFWVKIKTPGFQLKSFRLWLPIPRIAQAVFAEAFRGGLIQGIPVDRAILLASKVNPCHRFRYILQKMATYVRSGYSIEAALVKTGATVRPGLLAALRVGENHSCLVEELSSFASRTSRFTPETFLRAIGRSEEARDFAAALSRLLRDHRLTLREVEAAGQVADNSKGQFSRVVDQVAKLMQNGTSLPDALREYPAHFDSLYCGLLESTKSREEMKSCLENLGTCS